MCILQVQAVTLGDRSNKLDHFLGAPRHGFIRILGIVIVVTIVIIGIVIRQVHVPIHAPQMFFLPNKQIHETLQHRLQGTPGSLPGGMIPTVGTKCDYPLSSRRLANSAMHILIAIAIVVILMLASTTTIAVIVITVLNRIMIITVNRIIMIVGCCLFLLLLLVHVLCMLQLVCEERREHLKRKHALMHLLYVHV